MKVYLDTNVLLDLLLARPEGVDTAETVMAMCYRKELEGAVNTLTICNILYILRKYIGSARAEREVKRFCGFIALLPTTVGSVMDNLCGMHSDFEDAVQISCAMEWGADVILTRDKGGFVGSAIRVLSPQEFLEFNSAKGTD